MVDVAKQEDPRGIPLNEVGITHLQLPITLEDKTQGTQHTIGIFDAYVALPGNQKGTHMSRIGEAVYNNRQKVNQYGLIDAATEMRDKLDAEYGEISVSFSYYVSRKSPASGLDNIMVYQAEFTAGSDGTFFIGVDVDVQSVCPCAKEECGNGNSHVQRGLVSIKVKPVLGQWIWLEDLIEIAERAGSSPVLARLKRPDEKALVLSAFQNAKFCEDITRDAVVQLKGRTDIEWFEVSTTNYESIHAHNCKSTYRSC